MGDGGITKDVPPTPSVHLSLTKRCERAHNGRNSLTEAHVSQQRNGWETGNRVGRGSVDGEADQDLNSLARGGVVQVVAGLDLEIAPAGIVLGPLGALGLGAAGLFVQRA